MDSQEKVEIINNEVYVDGQQIYYTVDESDGNAVVDWSNDTVYFFMRGRGGTASLNQDIGANNQRIRVNRKTANEVYRAFEEVERNNEKILQSMQE